MNVDCVNPDPGFKVGGDTVVGLQVNKYVDFTYMGNLKNKINRNKLRNIENNFMVGGREGIGAIG